MNNDRGIRFIVICELILLLLRIIPAVSVGISYSLVECFWILFVWYSLYGVDTETGSRMMFSISAWSVLAAAGGYLAANASLMILAIYNGLPVSFFPLKYIVVLISAVLLRELLYIFWIYSLPELRSFMSLVRKASYPGYLIYGGTFLAFFFPRAEAAAFIPSLVLGSIIFFISVRRVYLCVYREIFKDKMDLT